MNISEKKKKRADYCVPCDILCLPHSSVSNLSHPIFFNGGREPLPSCPRKERKYTGDQ